MAEIGDVQHKSISTTTGRDLKVGHVCIRKRGGDISVYVEVADLKKVKNGKHGAAKIHVSGREVFSGKNIIEIVSNDDLIHIVNVDTINYIYEDYCYADNVFLVSRKEDSGNDNTELEELSIDKLFTDEQVQQVMAMINEISTKESIMFTVKVYVNESILKDIKVVVS